MSNTVKKISVCGIGPGHPDYIIPLVLKKAKKADVLIGGKRHLELFTLLKAQKIVFNGKLKELKDAIEQLSTKNIVILVSGDTGFHSLRRFLVTNLPNQQFNFIPGISSFQYFYAQLGIGYENAFKTSLHGVKTDFLNNFAEYDSIFLLTDKNNNWQAIAMQLAINNLGHLKYHIGINLSYPNEKIINTTAAEALTFELEEGLCAVIIETGKVNK